MLNLILNACDAMALTPVSRRVITVESSNTSEGYARVSVTDHGEGVPEHVGATLFEPFVSTKPSGLGIGLAISRSIVAAHGGTITAESAPSGGASFLFSIPGSNGVQHGQQQPAA
jgi:two-component system sensor kinase FixL